MLVAVLFAVLIGNICSVLLAALFLKLSNRALQYATQHITAFAGGALLGAAFLGMLPNAIKLSDYRISYFVLLGILFFFIIEKIMLWRMCNNEHCDRHNKASALMLMIGDSFHNFLDGIVIASAFLHSTSFGIVVTCSVFAHEIPQEIADFGVLIKAGISKKRAILYNILSGGTALLGALLALYLNTYITSALPYILALSAAGFMYVALADLIPALHKRTGIRYSVVQFLFLLLGIGVIIVAISSKP